MLGSILEKVVGWLAEGIANRRRIRLTVHAATFRGSGRAAYFLNVVNLSKTREIEITHVWLATEPPVSALNAERQLPRRLRPDEVWETWIYADAVPSSKRATALRLGRVRLSTGSVIKSKPNRTVPADGFVPGGSIPDSVTHPIWQQRVVALPRLEEGTIKLLPGHFDVFVHGRYEGTLCVPRGGDESGNVTLGRAAGSSTGHVGIFDPNLAPVHATLRFGDGGWRVVSHTSGSRVWLNGSWVAPDTERAIGDKDLIQIGIVELRFHEPS
jgi:hypothetical protein